ncbi:MAG: hypothetical protein ACE5DW_01960 [Thermodesulfobacteriota bacterium]
MRSLLIKRREFLYCLSGAALAIVLFFALLSYRYRGHLESESKKLQGMSHKGAVMEKAAADMKGLVRRLSAAESGSAVTGREVILASLDEIKIRLSASSMSLSSFDESDGALSIGVEIEAPLGDYADFVRNIHYLESMSTPWFTMQGVVIAAGKDGYNVRLRGVAMMPSKITPGE